LNLPHIYIYIYIYVYTYLFITTVLQRFNDSASSFFNWLPLVVLSPRSLPRCKFTSTPSSCLSSLPALISLQHLRSTPLCRPVKLQGSRYSFTSLFMKEIPRHILWLSLSVCLFVRLCVYHLHLRCISEWNALHLRCLQASAVQRLSDAGISESCFVYVRCGFVCSATRAHEYHASRGLLTRRGFRVSGSG